MLTSAESYTSFWSGSKGEMQNTSHAVMAQRVEAANSLDNFPTPPWATRALIEHVIATLVHFAN